MATVLARRASFAGYLRNSVNALRARSMSLRAGHRLAQAPSEAPTRRPRDIALTPAKAMARRRPTVWDAPGHWVDNKGDWSGLAKR